MDYLIAILLICIIVFVVVVGLLKYSEKKQNEFFENKIKNAKANAAQKIKLVHSDDLISNANKVDNSIIHSKIPKNNNPKKEKLAKWVDTDSYDNDLKNDKLEIETSLHNTDNIENDDDMKKILIKPFVLFVDDSLVMRKVVGELLRKNNYEVIIKNDGWEAITYLNSHSQKPDLIITDIQMPNMDGFQLIEAIRKENKFKRVPIIVISAHVEASDHLELMEEEIIQGFIRKPFEEDDLLNQAKYILKNY